MDLVDENLAEETIGSARVNSKVFCRVEEGHNLGRIRVRAAKGILQNKTLESLVNGLIAGSKEVKRSGVIYLNSTCEEFSFKDQAKCRNDMKSKY